MATKAYDWNTINQWKPTGNSEGGFTGTIEVGNGDNTISVPTSLWNAGSYLDGEYDNSGDRARLADYINMGLMSNQPAPHGSGGLNPDERADMMVTPDEKRALMAEASHPSNLFFSHPMSALMYQEDGTLGGPQTLLQNMGRGSLMGEGINSLMSNYMPSLETLDQAIPIPFGSGLMQAFPGHRIPTNPVMPEGSLDQPKAQTPENYNEFSGSLPAGTVPQTTGDMKHQRGIGSYADKAQAQAFNPMAFMNNFFGG